MHERVNAVVAGERGQAEIGNDEPLGRKRIGIVLGRPGGLRHHDVHTGRQRADGLIDREGRGDVGIERLLDRHLPLPDLGAALLGQAVEVIAIEGALEFASHHGFQQIAVADAVDFERDRRGIDADDGNAALSAARQHVGLAGETHQRFAVAHIDVEVSGFRQRLLHQRRDAGAQGDAVTLAVLETFDTELTVLRGERGLVLTGDGDERREIGALARQVLGELEAGTRRGRVGVDAVVEQAEAVILAHALVLLAHLGDLAQIERNPQRVERRPPDRAITKAAPHHDEAFCLLARIARALIGDIGGGRGALEQQGLLAIIARTDLQNGLGQPEPVRAVVGRDRHDLSEDLHAAAEVVALEGGIRFAPQRRGGFRHLTRFALDLGFQLDRRIGEIIAPERFVGGNGGDGQQQNERGCAGSANEREHGGSSIPVGRGFRSGLPR